MERIPIADAEELAAVRIVGEVDIDCAPELREELERILETSCLHLLVDIEGVKHLDSFSLGAFVGVRQRARGKGGSLGFVCHQPNLMRLFSMTNLDKLFHFYDSVEAFVQARTGPAADPVPTPPQRAPVPLRGPQARS